MTDYFARNQAWAKPGPYYTPLAATDEVKFRQWLQDNKSRVGEFDPQKPTNDYDLRGWWFDNAGAVPPKGHFVDTYKTPYHEKFSNESKYALPSAPQWLQTNDGWMLVDNGGKILVKE